MCITLKKKHDRIGSPGLSPRVDLGSANLKVFAPQRMRNYVGSEKRNPVYPNSGQCEYDKTFLS